MTGGSSTLSIRVYYEDTDCGNVVYYANYLKYMERARTEYLRERGISLTEYHEQGFTFVVIDAHVKYRASAHYNDILTATTRVSSTTSTMLVFTTEIRNELETLLVIGDITIACVNNRGRATRIPLVMLDAVADTQ